MRKLDQVNLTAENVDNMLSFETLSEMNKSLILGGAGDDESPTESKEQKCNKCEKCDKCEKCSGCSPDGIFGINSSFLPL